jgi:hypothetical protein
MLVMVLDTFLDGPVCCDNNNMSSLACSEGNK